MLLWINTFSDTTFRWSIVRMQSAALVLRLCISHVMS